MNKKNVTNHIYNTIKSILYKKNNLLISLLFFASTILFSNKCQGRIDETTLTTGRSLQEILAQHGYTSRAGNFIITADGIIENNHSEAKNLTTLQSRISKLTLAKANILRDNTPSKEAGSAQLLAQYIQQNYGKERSPLFKFIAALAQEHNEIIAIRTETLRLISNPGCKEEALKIIQKVCLYNEVLLYFDSMLEKLWEEIIYLFSLESYASNAH